jgi:hypothetical protein
VRVAKKGWVGWMLDACRSAGVDALSSDVCGDRSFQKLGPANLDSDTTLNIRRQPRERACTKV